MRYCGVFVLCVAAFFQTGHVASGQLFRQEAPSREYLNGTLPAFYNGDYNNTLRLLGNNLSRAVKIRQANHNTFLWLDSLCYYALQGECHFQMARYDEALMAFNSALQIYLEQSDWLTSISVSAQPGMAPRLPLPWGASVRPGSVGNFSRCQFQMTHEHVRVVPAGDQPGLMNQQEKSGIHADHIIHSLALAIRRRAEILGSLSKYDSDTKQLAEVLATRPHLPNHFTGSWVDVLYGLTLSAMGDDGGAETQLNRGLLMLGAFDHHLTPVALNELGNIALRAGRAEDAQRHYLEASFSAYQMSDPVLLGETFRNMANAQRLLQKNRPFPPVIEASNFFRAQRNTSPMTLLPILHEEAEGNIVLRRYDDAAKINGFSADVMKGTALFDTMHGARHHYLAAMIDYGFIATNLAAGKKPLPPLLDSGNKHLDAALTFLQRGSLRLYQLHKLDELFGRGMITTRGPITERVADELYDELLRESTEIDWLLQPMDSFVALSAMPLRAYEHWFTVAYQRGNFEKAFNIAERAKQARFFAALQRAESRLMAFRMLFEGEEATQSPEVLLQRQTLLLEFRDFSRLTDNVRNIKRQLVGIPAVPQNPDQASTQKTLLAELEQQSAIQESLLRVMALSRTRAPQIFPPIMTLEQIRSELPEGAAMLTFTEAHGTMYGFMIDQRTLIDWKILPESARDKSLFDLIVDFLQDLGNKGAGQVVGTKELTNAQGKWRESGNRLLWRLLGNRTRPTNFTELVIVPSGPLWYVPFEAMSVQSAEGQYRPLLRAGQTPLTIRYAPMASLGVTSNPQGRGVNAETLVLSGKLISRDSPDVALEAVNRFTHAGVRNIALMRADEKTSPLPSSASAFASQVQQLVVLDEIDPRGVPLGWSPFSHDRTKARNPVASWLMLPWGGPKLVVMPGFRTSAEHSLKQQGLQHGDDLFLSSMLLQACGARTILLSRWRTGGRVSYDLTEQFLLQLADKPAAEAWRQAILEVGTSVLNMGEEPRVRKEAGGGDDPIANHPFFWGAFMLIDRGEKQE